MIKVNFKKYFIFSILFLLLILSIDSFTKEEKEGIERITISDAKQLKGIWEAFYVYQEIPRQERINMHIPPLPVRKEFESKEEHQDRVNTIKEVYERRIEADIKNEINNEQRFKNIVFKLEFSYDPHRINQDSNIEKSYKSYNYIEKDNLRIQEDIACLNFSLDKYDMEDKKFPVIFPVSQFPQEEKKWFYYIRKSSYGDYYMEMFKKAYEEKTEQWLIKFDELPAYIPFSLNKAKTVRENEKQLILELEFRPTLAEKEVNSDTTYYILEAKLISVMLKEGNETIYVMVNNLN